VVNAFVMTHKEMKTFLEYYSQIIKKLYDWLSTCIILRTHYEIIKTQ